MRRRPLECRSTLGYKAACSVKEPMQVGWPNGCHKLKGGYHVSKKFLPSVFIVSVLALTSGCAVNRATATVSADSDLSKVKTFYVVQQPKDDRGIEKLISDNLTARG